MEIQAAGFLLFMKRRAWCGSWLMIRLSLVAAIFLTAMVTSHAVGTAALALEGPVVVTNCDTPGDIRMLYPGGLKKALTFSWDDGREYDYKLVELMDKYGLRGTFHLCSGLLDKPGYVKSQDVKKLYAKHEVASHTINHANLPQCDDAKLKQEVMEDCKALEKLVGYPVYGLAYPGGEADERVVKMLPTFGIRYARVVGTHNWFAMPKSRMTWVMTSTIGPVAGNAKRFLEWGTFPALLSAWGHSYELGEGNVWGTMDEIGKALGGRKDIWYATNIEIINYMDATKMLVFSSDKKSVQNPTKLEIWISVKDKPYKIAPGQKVALK